MKKIFFSLIVVITLFSCDPPGKGYKYRVNYTSTEGYPISDYTNEYKVLDGCVTFNGVQWGLKTICGNFEIQPN